jgi:hypothetical protein
MSTLTLAPAVSPGSDERSRGSRGWWRNGVNRPGQSEEMS